MASGEKSEDFELRGLLRGRDQDGAARCRDAEDDAPRGSRLFGLSRSRPLRLGAVQARMDPLLLEALRFGVAILAGGIVAVIAGERARDAFDAERARRLTRCSAPRGCHPARAAPWRSRLHVPRVRALREMARRHDGASESGSCFAEVGSAIALGPRGKSRSREVAPGLRVGGRSRL